MTNKEVASILTEVKDALKALNDKMTALELRITRLEFEKYTKIAPMPAPSPLPQPYYDPYNPWKYDNTGGAKWESSLTGNMELRIFDE